MSFVARTALRTALRPSARRFATEAAEATEYTTANSAHLAHVEHVRAHNVETSDLWRKISYYVALPSIFVVGAWVYKLEVAHAEHQKHELEANGGEMPETPQYEYLNKRVKAFPWGNNSLFYNPEVNKDLN